MPSAAGAIIFATCCVHGQARVALASSASAISVNADEVSLDLLVHDQNGRPGLDLQPSQINVTDGGTPSP